MAELLQDCSDCGSPVEVGATVCGHCGNRIEWPDPATDPAKAPAVGPSPTTSPAPAAGAGRGLLPAILVDLVVTSARGSRSVQLESGDTIEVGRDVGPLTDLCSDNVSGIHAHIRVGDDDVVVEDVGTDGRGSTNGTFVDGTRLVPKQPTVLSDGAVVECGTQPPLTIRVKVTRS